VIVAGCTIVPWQRPSGPSHNPSGISSRTIAEGDIVAYDISCSMTEAKWIGSQSKRSTWFSIRIQTLYINFKIRLQIIFMNEYK